MGNKYSKWSIIFLLLIFSIILIYKVKVLNFHPKMVVPIYAYWVQLNMELDGHGNDVLIKTFIPNTEANQKITEKIRSLGPFAYQNNIQGGNNELILNGDNVKGHQEIMVKFLAIIKSVQFYLPDKLEIPESYPAEMNQYLAATEYVQKDDPAISRLAKKLGISQTKNLAKAVKLAYQFTADSLGVTTFSARTDALLALKLREASCNGKSRLMVALLRNKGIPARLVGGVIMGSGKKKTTHQWAEVWMQEHWVPFCPLNKHFGEIPDRYLAFYRGDYSMFTRSANINFKYHYDMNRVMMPRESAAKKSEKSWLNIFNLWEMFRKAGINLELLKILLMIPIGSIVIIIFRNVIGIQTFGTFLPVLIATSYRDSGLWWGHVVFVCVIASGLFTRYALEKLNLLHSPKLTIILVSVIVTLIFITLIGIEFENSNLFSASMFPLAIMALTIERFCIIADSDGAIKAVKIFLWSIVVITFCYLSMLSVFLQSILMAFPECLLVVVAISIYLGSWNKLRLAEFYRFRKLIWESKAIK